LNSLEEENKSIIVSYRILEKDKNTLEKARGIKHGFPSKFIS